MELQIKPNFLGVGAMKSATTWISECLRYHPEVFVSDIKELHFFSDNLSKGSQWYFNHFKEAKEKKAIGEFSICYMDDLRYPEMIKELLGPIKIIISVRNPIERFISHFKHNRRVELKAKYLNENTINKEKFELAVSEFPNLLTRGLYIKPILKYYEVFGQENVLVVFKDDIDDNPHNVVEDIYAFLDVDRSFKPPVINKSVSIGIVPKFKFLEDVRVQLYGKSKKYFPKFIVLMRKYRIAELYRKINKQKSDLVFTREVLDLLKKYYLDEIQQLEVLFKRDLTKWK